MSLWGGALWFMVFVTCRTLEPRKKKDLVRVETIRKKSQISPSAAQSPGMSSFSLSSLPQRCFWHHLLHSRAAGPLKQQGSDLQTSWEVKAAVRF